MNHYDSNYASNLDRDEEEQPMSDEPRMIKVRVTVSTNKALSEVHKDVEIDAEDWESMDEKDRDDMLSETRDQLMSWDYKVIDDERDSKADLAKAMLADARKARKRNRK